VIGVGQLLEVPRGARPGTVRVAEEGPLFEGAADFSSLRRSGNPEHAVIVAVNHAFPRALIHPHGAVKAPAAERFCLSPMVSGTTTKYALGGAQV